MGEYMAAQMDRQIEGAISENEQLRRDLEIALDMLAQWCVAVDVNGTGWDDWEHWPEAEANARLIAAAPDLLECLRAVEVLFAPHCKDSTQADWLDKAQALLRRLGAA